MLPKSYRCHDQLGCLEKTRDDRSFVNDHWFKNLKECQQNCKKKPYRATNPQFDLNDLLPLVHKLGKRDEERKIKEKKEQKERKETAKKEKRKTGISTEQTAMWIEEIEKETRAKRMSPPKSPRSPKSPKGRKRSRSRSRSPKKIIKWKKGSNIINLQ
jgi:hypothetical protein